jgi:hypothetical protein
VAAESSDHTQEPHYLYGEIVSIEPDVLVLGYLAGPNLEWRTVEYPLFLRGAFYNPLSESDIAFAEETLVGRPAACIKPAGEIVYPATFWSTCMVFFGAGPGGETAVQATPVLSLHLRAPVVDTMRSHPQFLSGEGFEVGN